MSTDEVFPTGGVLSLGSGRNVMTTKDIADGLVRELVAKVGHGSHNPVVAPTWILLRHPHHQILDLLINPGPALSSPRLRSIKLVSDQFPIPAQNRIGFGRDGYFLKCLAAQPMSNFSQGCPLSIRKVQTSF